jgi:hypothetical protein
VPGRASGLAMPKFSDRWTARHEFQPMIGPARRPEMAPQDSVLMKFLGQDSFYIDSYLNFLTCIEFSYGV